ncbi:hypothetical protein DTO164E3_7803 [Paecilomyces variotii]|nr:hypothetical protein DTO164E3_7803 [Paecilomyces variotii]KAJ9351604.1 hypothetical protein DTO280E4_8175 [Paecilomyces variotii]
MELINKTSFFQGTKKYWQNVAHDSKQQWKGLDSLIQHMMEERDDAHEKYLKAEKKLKELEKKDAGAAAATEEAAEEAAADDVVAALALMSGGSGEASGRGMYMLNHAKRYMPV